MTVQPEQQKCCSITRKQNRKLCVTQIKENEIFHNSWSSDVSPTVYVVVRDMLNWTSTIGVLWHTTCTVDIALFDVFRELHCSAFKGVGDISKS